MFRVPLQGLSESKKFRAWTKCKDSRRATRFAQTISPSALTSMPGTSRFTKTLPKSPCPHPPAPQKGSRNGACFLLYRLGKSSNDQLRKTKARQESLTMCKSFKPRRFVVFQVCLQNDQRQKQQKQKCVKSRKVLLIVRAAAKLCCRRRSLYSTKTRNQGRVVFPSEISTLPLTPHFCSETLSIMLRE